MNSLRRQSYRANGGKQTDIQTVGKTITITKPQEEEIDMYIFLYIPMFPYNKQHVEIETVAQNLLLDYVSSLRVHFYSNF